VHNASQKSGDRQQNLSGQPETNLLTATIIDDSRPELSLMRLALAANGNFGPVAEFNSPVRALEAFASGSIPTDLILLDYRMPWMSGPEFVAAFEKLTGPHHHRTRIALFSAMPTAELEKVEIKSRHLLGIFPKPITLEIIDELVDGMRRAQAL